MKNYNYKTKQCEIKDLSEKLLSILCHKKNIFFLCVCKMYLTSAERCKNAGVQFLRVRKTGRIWARWRWIKYKK